MARSLDIPGVVSSGLGKGAYFISLAWVQTRLIELIGVKPYPGTLNLRVPNDLRDELFALRKLFTPVLAPHGGICPAYLLAVNLRPTAGPEVAAWAVLPEATVHADTIEVVSQYSLRDHLGLKDGDQVELKVRIN